ncbi:DUF4349 domain-containing protein [Wenjunlia vitaminophila]|uniref:DUF4349 domain-containing protein n=1 Tax=Wenjunlia vitaminophila TaxID=76728 RepID=UPI0003629990|nr:DUF4349 domain-containing protein [Wenjunlia vitaminophila]
MHSPPSGAPGRRRVRRLPLLALPLALLVPVTGCGSSGGGSDGSADQAAVAPADQRGERGPGEGTSADKAAPQAARTTDSDQDPTVRKETPVAAKTHVIRTATLEIRTRDLSDAVDRARQLADGAGGYVGNERTETDDLGQAHSRLVLRVPVDTYDDTLEQLTELGGAKGNELTGRTESTKDVTNQVVDTDSRLKAQKASVDRVRELMGEARTIADVVALEAELTSRQADLDSYQRQLESLRDRTSMATVTVELTEPAKEEEKKDDDEGIGESVGDALRGGWDALVVAVGAVLVALAASLPFLVLALLVYLLLRVLVRRGVIRRPRTAAVPVPASTPLPVPGPLPPPTPGVTGPAPAPAHQAPPPSPTAEPPADGEAPRGS